MTICIYEIRNKENDNFYIGSTNNYKKRKRRHLTDLRNNVHHNTYLQRAFNKYGEKSFEFNILIELDNKESLFEHEQKAIDEMNPPYNIGAVGGGDNYSNHPNKEELRIKLTNHLRSWRENLTDVEKEELIKRNYIGKNNPNYGNKWNEDQRLTASKRMKKHFKDNPWQKEKMVETSRNYWDNISEEDYEKFCELKKIQNAGERNPFHGKTHSKETLNKMSDVRKKFYKSMSEKEKYEKLKVTRKISIDGEIFNTCMSAAKKLGVNNGTITHRLKSPNYPNYIYLDKQRTKVIKAKNIWVAYRPNDPVWYVGYTSTELSINLSEAKILNIAPTTIASCISYRRGQHKEWAFFKIPISK